MTKLYAEIYIVAIDELMPETDYCMLRVHAKKKDEEEWTYLGLHDVVRLGGYLVFDSKKPDSEFFIKSDKDNLLLYHRAENLSITFVQQHDGER